MNPKGRYSESYDHGYDIYIIQLWYYRWISQTDTVEGIWSIYKITLSIKTLKKAAIKYYSIKNNFTE